MASISAEFKPPIYQPHYLIRRRLLSALTELCPQLKGKVLDFGCGSKPYHSLFDADSYTGLDFENPGHPHINESIDVFYDGKSIPFSNDHFDAVFSSEVFEHVFNLPEILKEINRVIKPGGQLLLTCPFLFGEHEEPNDFARYSSFGIRSLIEEAGFEIIEQRKTGNSIEAISQLRLMYIHLHIFPVIKKIPLLRSIFRYIFYTSLNVGALLLSKILPLGKDMYLNNVILARKKASS